MTVNELYLDVSRIAYFLSPFIAVLTFIGSYATPQIISGNPTSSTSAVAIFLLSVGVVVVLIDRFEKDIVEFRWKVHQEKFYERVK